MKYRALRCFDAGTGPIQPGQFYSGPCMEWLLKDGCLEEVEGDGLASEGEEKSNPEPKSPPKPKGKKKKDD